MDSNAYQAKIIPQHGQKGPKTLFGINKTETSRWNAERAAEQELEFMREANAFSAAEAHKARQFSSQEALRQMEFQERMSNTAHQRAVADLRAAGLNPLLAAGQGAHVGAGAMGSASSASGQKGSASQADVGTGAEFATLISAAVIAGGSVVSSAFRQAGRKIVKNKIGFGP